MGKQLQNLQRVRPVGGAVAALVAAQGANADAEPFGGLWLRPALAFPVGNQTGNQGARGKRVALGAAWARRVGRRGVLLTAHGKRL